MQKNKIKKYNDTATRAIELLKLFFEQDLTIEDAAKILQNNNEFENEIRPESLYKYINTFKLLGIIIEKNKNKYKYSVKEFPFELLLSKEQIEGFNFLTEYAKHLFQNKDLILTQNVLEKYTYFTQKLKDITKQKLKQKYSELFSYKLDKEKFAIFRQLCKEKQKLSFCYFNLDLNSNQKFIVEPWETIITPTGYILKAYNPSSAELQNFYIENISNLKQLPSKIKPVNVKNSVTFKITGRLARSYELKQGERITHFEPEYKIITNTEEDKELLLKRLLRYGTSCKILYPKNFIEKTTTTLKKIKTNYS